MYSLAILCFWPFLHEPLSVHNMKEASTLARCCCDDISNAVVLLKLPLILISLGSGFLLSHYWKLGNLLCTFSSSDGSPVKSSNLFSSTVTTDQPTQYSPSALLGRRDQPQTGSSITRLASRSTFHVVSGVLLTATRMPLPLAFHQPHDCPMIEKRDAF